VPTTVNAATNPADPAVRVPRRITSRALLNGQRELRIQHGAEEYRLRHTASGKLILTK